MISLLWMEWSKEGDPLKATAQKTAYRFIATMTKAGIALASGIQRIITIGSGAEACWILRWWKFKRMLVAPCIVLHRSENFQISWI